MYQRCYERAFERARGTYLAFAEAVDAARARLGLAFQPHRDPLDPRSMQRRSHLRGELLRRDAALDRRLTPTPPDQSPLGRLR